MYRTDINDLIEYPFDLIVNDYTKLYELTNYWRKNIPSKKILKNIKEYLRINTSIIYNIAYNLFDYNIIDNQNTDPDIEDIRSYFYKIKERNLELIDNLLFFGAIITDKDLIKIKK